MLKRFTVGFITLLITILAFIVFGILIPAGSFKTISPHFAGTTRIVPIEIAGPEDIEIDRSTGLVFISVDDRRTNRLESNQVQGGILTYSVSAGIDSIKNITPEGLPDFHPHGISLFRQNDSTLFLFAINHHAGGKNTVERFIWINNSLQHLESISDEALMTSPNDLLAVGERQFYVTNDHRYQQGFARMVEEYLQLSISYVNYFDGKIFETVAEGIGYANGINQSSDGNYIFVAACTGRSLHVFSKNKDGSLTPVEKIKLGTGPDNITLDADGSLLIGCHPQLLKFVAHTKDAAKHSPSQVLRITYSSSNYRIQELFLNNGESYSGSSVAVVYGNTMLVGSVFEPALLVCTTEK